MVFDIKSLTLWAVISANVVYPACLYLSCPETAVRCDWAFRPVRLDDPLLGEMTRSVVWRYWGL